MGHFLHNLTKQCIMKARRGVYTSQVANNICIITSMKKNNNVIITVC